MRVVLAVAALAVLGACATAPAAPKVATAAAAAPAAAPAAAKAKPAKVKCRVASSGLGSNMKKKECTTVEQRADPGDKDGSRDEARRFQRALGVDESNAQ